MASRFSFKNSESTSSNTDKNSNTVIKRFPVYLSNSFNKKIHVLKYPLRDDSRSYSSDNDLTNSNCLKFKPKTGNLTMEFKIDPESVHYSEKNTFPEKKIDLNSRHISNKGNYALCTFKKGNIYFSPVESSKQMVPCYDYINKRQKAIENVPKTKTTVKKEPKITTVVQKLRVVEKNNMSLYKNFLSRLKSIAEEAPEPLEMSEGTSKHQSDIDKTPMNRINSVVEPNKFLDFLKEERTQFGGMKKSEEIYSHKNNNTKSGLSREFIRRNLKTFDQKILAILRNTGTATFEEILSVLEIKNVKEREREIESLKNALKRMAHFIKGVWVPKSVFICEGREKFARDYLLALFYESKHGEISIKHWNSVAKLSFEKSFKILEPISECKKDINKRCLKKRDNSKTVLSNDDSDSDYFMRLRATSYWILTGGKVINDHITPEIERESKEQLEIFFEELFLKHGLCSKGYIRRMLIKSVIEMGLVSALSFVTFEKALEEANTFCHVVSETLFFRKIKNNAEDEQRKFLVEFMLGKKTSTREELEDELTKAKGKPAPGSLTRILTELFTPLSNHRYKLRVWGNFQK